MGRRRHVGMFGQAILLGIASGSPRAEAAQPLPWQDHDLPHVSKEHTVEIASQRHEYAIRMGGAVDMDHAMTRECRQWRIGWQPNESLTIANIGAVPVEAAKVIVNDRGDWYTIDRLLREATASAGNDQEKVYLIWEFCRSNRHHDDPIFGTHFAGEMHDPVKMLMSLGAGLCDDAGAIGSGLFYAAGFREPKPFVRCLHGHMMCEVFANKRWQFMDIDEDVFYLDRENELPVGGDLIARDHDLAHREFHYGPVFGKWEAGYSAAALFGGDDGHAYTAVQGHQIRVNLRPGERIEYRWDNIGKWAREEPGYGRRWVGNSRIIYEPPLDGPKGGADEARNVTRSSAKGQTTMAAASGEGELVYRMSSPFVFCGGRLEAAFILDEPNDRAVIEVRANDNKGKGKTGPVKVWEAAGPGLKEADIEIDDAIGPTSGAPKYEFWVRIRLIALNAKGGASLTRLVLRGDVMVSPIALPRLRLGENKVVYTDESKDGRKVRVTCRWRETTATLPLPAPTASHPPDDRTVRDEVLTYKWRPLPGATAYHLQVCRDPAMRWPYRPSLDVVCQGTEFTVPFWGIYAPDTTYYWRLRTQNDKGVWGDWGKVRTFRWAGPRVPVDVKLTPSDGAFTLSWKPNPRGERPGSYEVYGSDIKGFSVSKKAVEIPWLGTVSGNYLGRTTATEMVVAGWKASESPPQGVEQPGNLNRCYYRVVAVDQHGTRSGCSDYAEMPHPYVWSKPAASARVGQAYRYEPKFICDMGDLQHRYEPPENKFWEQEQLTFSMSAGPKWLTIDPKTGLLTGTPPVGSVGEHEVRLRVVASFEPRTGKDRFIKDLPPRESVQTFELVVGR